MINWMITSSVLIAIVLLLRWILKGRISQRLQYALWLPVLLRLLIPFSIGSSEMSVLNTLPTTTPSIHTEAEVVPQVTVPVFNEEITAPSANTSVVPQISASNPEAKAVPWETILLSLYIAGAVSIAAGFLFLNTELSVRLRRSRSAMKPTGKLTTYHSDAVETPCLFGLFCPAIYVTTEALCSPHTLQHSVSHEQTHYRHGDHIWSVLRGLCIALHWYNPLVWVAAVASGRDAELACDEATLLRLGETERASYARTLISLSSKRRSALSLAATTMTGGKGSLKERIARIVKQPKMAVYTPIILILVCTLAVGCTFFDAKSDPSAEAPVSESTEPSSEPDTYRYTGPVTEYREPTEPTVAPEDLVLPHYVLMPFFTDDPTADMTITYRESSQVQYKTYAVPEDSAEGLYSLISSREWKVLDEKPQLPDCPSLLISRETSFGTVILHNGNTGILEYHTADGSYYWKTWEQEGILLIEFKTKHEYYWSESVGRQFAPFAYDGNAEGALQMLVETVYPQFYMELSPGHYDRMIEYNVISTDIYEVREDGKAITGEFGFVFTPDSELRIPIAGEDYAQGIYEGMIRNSMCVSLELKEDGLWHYTFDQDPMPLP